ncbi:hypothetical protein BDA96_03G053400 [Sorghum bicolor]|uniref:Uncharacterized protein n=2 Tax=Sorghum bicolor TaxID=4558 RepID=A0A921ULW4_SORBI|nr:embryo-specific protein ATS3A [Sorghum bicolor]EES02382.1 hypothetical protein SORBI_3003G050200 [Sorghum bicolor]KAG0536319.1 hypothetical protein BDA96_03G053400 [Sorghum bicolor]|eukprot:XP_002457262.1 embryo-specific protein ATS3A [Sorghum bicolor]
MASSTVPPQRVALLALAVLYLSLPASSHPLPREAATAAAGEASEPDDAAAAVARRACTYTVQIKTSCSSPRSSADAVSLAFGDAYRNEVYAARLTPRYGFERCATDTFRVSGPCGYGVCYLYLRRSGRAGWTPEWVRVYEPATSATPSTFYYGDPLPDGVWYGFDRCVAAGAGAGAGTSSEPGAAAQAL